MKIKDLKKYGIPSYFLDIWKENYSSCLLSLQEEAIKKYGILDCGEDKEGRMQYAPTGRIDSRFRGNDMKGSGNDRKGNGNGIKGSGNDITPNVIANDRRECGNPKQVNLNSLLPSPLERNCRGLIHQTHPSYFPLLSEGEG